MRIAIDARYLTAEYTGIGTFSIRFLEALSDLEPEHEFEVLVHESFTGKLQLGPNFRVHEHPAPAVSLASVSTIGRFLASLEPDLVHATFPLTSPAWRGPLISTFHDLQPMLDPDFHGARPWIQRAAYGAFYRWAYHGTLRRSLYVLCDSHYTRRQIQEWQPTYAGKCHVVHLGVGPEASLHPTPEEQERVFEERSLPDRFVLYLGSTRPNKNLVRMLDGFLKYKAAFPDDPVKWVMVVRPDRFFEPVLNRLRRDGLLGEVKILEQVTETEKRVLMARTEALLFVTLYEGFGLPVLEAQALGTPVLISRDGALPEVGGSAALAVDGHDSDSIMSGIVTILRDEQKRAELRQRGPQNAARFTWAAHARETLNVYEHLVQPMLEFPRNATQYPQRDIQ
jgi:glycosyltransferase involved in cell wall biosynthesis